MGTELIQSEEKPTAVPKALTYKARLRATLADWQERWPAVFTRPVTPLAVGIARAIREQTGLNRKELNIPLRYWTTTKPYLQAVARGTLRRNLDGSEAGMPDEAARKDALDQLRQRKEREQVKAAEKAERGQTPCNG